MSESINNSELFVTLGRVEAKVDALGSIDGRLRSVEQDVHVLKEGQNKRAPWWVVVGIVFGAVTCVGALVALFLTLSRIADVLAAAPGI